MRGNIRRHTDSDTVRAVYEKIGVSCGQNDRLHSRIVEVRIKVDRFFVYFTKHFESHFAHTRFCVSVCRRRVAVHGTEVTVSVYKRNVYREILRETNERVVNRTVAVRVIFTENVTDDRSALFIRLIGR